MNNNGTHSVDYLETRKIMWDKVGMARNAEGLNQAIVEIAALREEFYKDVKCQVLIKGSTKKKSSPCC
jgi:succinate dehydrogenase / fumarate reductase flavoprotein subunit